MSEENVAIFQRLVDDAGHRDAEALVAYLSPEVEWHPALPQSLGGDEAVYRGHAGVRKLMAELSDAFDQAHFEIPDVRDLDDRILGLGRLQTAGRSSGLETESPFAFLVDFEGGMAIRVRSYLEHGQALEAAGL
jgi:ketosteroid isomerase-like protein